MLNKDVKVDLYSEISRLIQIYPFSEFLSHRYVRESMKHLFYVSCIVRETKRILAFSSL